MTNPITPTCACGCGQPCRARSKYASEKCQQRASRIAQREYNNAYQTVRRTKFHHAYPARREVIIIDPCVADPYTVTFHEYQMYAGKYLPGTKIIIDGAELVL